MIMLSYPPTLFSSEQTYSEALHNAIEIQKALLELSATDLIANSSEQKHSLFSSRREIFKSELEAFSVKKNVKTNGFSLN